MALKQEQFTGEWDSIPKPVIANEVPFDSTVGYVTPRIWIDITLRESEIDHVYNSFIRW